MTKSRGFSIRRLRALILIALAVGMTVFTVSILTQLASLSDRFGPQVRADLEWRAMRGAAELANAADLGVAMSDRALVQQAFAPYAASEDVLAIVAVDPEGTVIAQRGDFAPIQLLFAAKPGVVLDGPGYLTSWAPVSIEGAVVGSVAIAVSTTRLTETRGTLDTVSHITLISGALILALGIVVIMFFTRAVAQRDEQLNDHAANLEKRVEERTRELDERNREMRGVLDNVAQGFITIDTYGQMATERSAIVDTWFGDMPNGRLSDLLRDRSPEFASWLDASLEMIRDDFMPLEVCLAQMPHSFVSEGCSFAVSYSPIMEGEKLQRLLVIISDVTAQLAHERAELEQRELVAVFRRVGSDRTACEEFLEEAGAQVEQLQRPESRVVHDRALHTLKGNAGMFGFERFAALCHTIESELRDTGDAAVTEEQSARVATAWKDVVATLRSLLGDSSRDVVQIDRTELAAAIADARAGASGHDLGIVLAKWCDEPVRRRFERFGEQARALAQRLGKKPVEIAIHDNNVRLDGEKWSALWASLVHVVRNAVDHGIHDDNPSPTLTFYASRDDRELVIAIADNGAGVSWDAIRAKAERAGLPSATHGDLVDAMFADGLSTRETATDTSGRGIGLSAVRSVVQALGGRIDVLSERGKGTRFELRFAATRYTLSSISKAS
jgi:HPt (histidine-containing phosphotransfer) domain-containing protein/signal transduction histidine kinase